MPKTTSFRASAPPSESLLETTHGKVRGSFENGVHVFKGLRYGATTAGRDRFLPPQPVKPWAGVVDATVWGSSAPQNPVREHTDPFYSWYAAIQPVSEDCLFLNVFTPAIDSAKRPVMFWIHGGGWREFSGTAPGFNGTRLAREQDVVVVTINHRLSAFGHLVLEGSDGRFANSGNGGLLDIVAALAWVRDNATSFGGDADNVTLFGESGGASKIAALLAMRSAQGLFHKAILQSCGGGMRLAGPDEAVWLASQLAGQLGWNKLDAERLQELPMEALLSALSHTASARFRGVIDGRNFDGDPWYPVAPEISKHVPVMAGYTNTEMTYFFRFDPGYLSLTWADIRRRLIRFLEIASDKAGELIEIYRSFYPQHEACEILMMLTSDFVVKRTTLKIAALQADTASAPVYAYMFERETPVEGGRMRSPHTTEVPFIFGTTDAAVAQVGAGSDIAPMTGIMMATWAGFARTGNPNNSLLPAWLPFREADPWTMVLNVQSRLERDPGGHPRSALNSLPCYGYGNPIQHLLTD